MTVLLFSRSRALWWTRDGYTPDMAQAARWPRTEADRLASATPAGETLLVADPRALGRVVPPSATEARRELLRLRLWIARAAGQVDELAGAADPTAQARALAARMRAVAALGGGIHG